jgi:hypothetical protein
MKLATLVLLIAACAPAPTSPWGPGSAASGGGQYAAAAAPGASCRATLECYASCDMTPDCMQGCDQRAGADDVALAHASMSCIANSECGADQDCVVQRCASELTACTEIAIAPAAPAAPAGQPQPQPGAVAATGSLDLIYSVPAGWTEHRSADAIRLSHVVSDSYSTVSHTIVILASQPMRGSLTQTFHALWGELVSPSFKSTYAQGIVPAPMRRRLASGYIVAFDGELMDANQGGMFTTVLYLLSSGDRVVPILAMYGSLDAAKTEPVMSAWFDSLSISGASPPQTALFDPSEIAGEWSTQAAEYANYVDSSGRYVGDANIAVRQDHTFDADGSYHAYASAYQSGRGFDRESTKGSWSVEDDTIVVETGGKTTRLRVFAVAYHRNVLSLRLPPSYASTEVVELTRPRSLGDWYGKVK